MRGVGVAMEKTDRQGFNILLPHQAVQAGACAGEIQRHLDRAVIVAAFVDLRPAPPWHQGVGKYEAQVKYVVAFLLTHI